LKIKVRQKLKIAVVSPFLDKRHGSERIIVEWLSHLTDEFEIHLYSQQVEDLNSTKFTWHRIPKLPGPHLLNFLWWVAANRLWRDRDRRLRRLRHDLVFSSGTNCLDADVICVHITFAKYVRQVRTEMKFARNPTQEWPRLLHRKLYYRIAVFLEDRAYKNRATALVVNSRKTVGELRELFGRTDDIPVLYLGLDHDVFNTATRAKLREAARSALAIPQSQFVLILVGNDWRNKGVRVLLDAVAALRDRPIRLLIVTDEDLSAGRRLVAEKALDDRVSFLPPRRDIEFYYAAADAYVGPSLQDAYGIPPAEAMACGLPVIVSAAAGVSEIVTNGVDGMILDDPKDETKLAAMIRRLYEDREFRNRLGVKAAETAGQYTWERNGRELSAIFKEVIRRKTQAGLQTPAQES
jgi:glycosyltransferase involved in cell wall biosynthesis